MKALLIAEIGIDPTVIEKVIKRHIDCNFVLIKGLPLHKKLSTVLYDNKLSFSIMDSKHTDVDIYKALGKIVPSIDKVICLSNLGNISKFLSKYDNVEFYLDKPVFVGKYIDMPNLDVINIDKTPNTLRVANGEILRQLRKFSRFNLLTTVYNSKIISKDNGRKSNLNIIHAYLRSIGIYVDIEDEVFEECSIKNMLELLGEHPIKSLVVNNNISDVNKHLAYSICNPDVKLLSLLRTKDIDMQNAIKLIDKHINGKIVLVTDSDADGTDGAALGYKYFKEYLNKDITVLVNERKYGNGVNQHLTDEILEINPDLVMTLDHGSKDDDRYKQLKDNDIDIIVTDHHDLDLSGRPKNVDAFINCMDHECGLPEYISGTTVFYALCLNHHYNINKTDILSSLLPYVAITVVSDMMPLDKPLNRYLFKMGREIMEDGKTPYIEAMRLKEHNAIALSFNLITYINAANRMEDANLAFKFLSALNIHSAEAYSSVIRKLNNAKKKRVTNIMKNIKLDVYDNLVVSIMNDTIDGLLSLVASRLINKYGRTIISLMIDKDGNYKGSLRAVGDNVNIVKTLDKINNKYHCFTKYGGHKGAGGVTVLGSKMEEFKIGLRELLPKDIIKRNIVPLQVNIKHLHNGVYEVMDELDPYGFNFRRPVFQVTGRVVRVLKRGLNIIVLKDDNNHTIDIKTFNKCGYNTGDALTINVEMRKINELEIWETED